MRAVSQVRPLTFPQVVGVAVLGALLLLVSVPASLAHAVSTFTVTTTADNGSDVAPLAGSLRKAIIDADNNVGADVIEFAIGAAGSQQTIVPPRPLPLVTGPTLVDGWSQGGSGYTGPPLIEIDGVNASGAAGLWLLSGAANSTVRGLAINGFGDAAIILDATATNAVVVGNYLGTRLDGATPHGNQIGISVVGSQVTIGGTTATERNIISGNSTRGVFIVGGSQARVIGNYIGTDVTGLVAVGNPTGIQITGGSDITVGGTTAGAGNLISGNTANGVSVSGGSTTGVTLQGNRIGTNAAGGGALGNGGSGIDVNGAPDVTIGGTASGAGNLISGNTLIGINVHGATATGATIQGNYVGLNATTTTAIPNGDGISINGAPGAEIGGASAGAGNVVSGNTDSGILIQGANATGAVVQGNLVGINAAGDGALANVSGITVTDAPGVTIGGTSPTSRNVVSGNTNSGVLVQGAGSTGTTIQGNYVGTSVNGTKALGNTLNGIFIKGAPNTSIGGTAAGAGNVISGNPGRNIIVFLPGATGTMIRGNFVGTDASGTVGLANGTGIEVDGAPGVTIGGTTAGAGNVISGNANGISLDNAGAAGAVIQGNRIGTNAAGTAAIANVVGIAILDAPGTTVGGTTAGAGNTIANNSGAGVVVTGSINNSLRGNAIFGNGGLGIDLKGDGVTANNDPGDGDTGPNNLQNFPVLGAAYLSGGATRLIGTLNSVAGTAYQIDLYDSPSCDPSGNGEGQTYLGSTSALTDGTGNATFTATSLPPVSASSVVTATATDPNNNTSEFSACRAVIVPGVTESPSSVAVAEGGAGSSFTVALTAVPVSPVTVTLATDAANVTLVPTTLTFAADASALTPQSVTVTAVDDLLAEGPHSRTVTFALTSVDPGYNGFPVGPVTVNIADNDTTGIVVSPTSGLVTTEAGGTASVSVRLTSIPSSAVTLPIRSSDTTEGTVAPTTLTFQPDATALAPQNITVTGVDDPVADGNVAYAIELGPSSSADPAYNNQTLAPVTATNQDDEGAPQIVVSATTGLVTTEAGGIATFTVRLSTVPTGAVTIPLSSSDTTEGAVSPGSLTFQPNASALSTQTVTVTGLDDQITDGDVAYTIVLGAAVSSDPAYNGQNPSDVAVTNRDDDSSGTLRFTATTVQVPENAGQVTLTVERGGAVPSSSGGAAVRPAVLSPVSVAYATADGTARAGQDYTATAGTLTFGVDETTKTIVVPLVVDENVENPETFTLTLRNPTGGATLGSGATVTVTIVDTSQGTPPQRPDDNKDDNKPKETEEQRQQRQNTNKGNKDDVHVEGNVVEVHQTDQQDGQSPYVMIADKDGLVRVNLLCGDQCPTIRVGDYLEADGEKQNEALFDATDVSISRPR